MAEEEDTAQQDLKYTFWTKNPINCPVCGNAFKREEMLTGGGRLLAGKLTLELRRLYEPSKRFGDLIKPLIYPVTVCTACLFAAFREDFDKPDKKLIDKAHMNMDKRLANLARIFPGLDFNSSRVLEHGAMSYLLAVEGYSYFDKWVSPTMKKAIASIRAAWLFGDLETANPDMSQYGDLSNFFYKKALFFYQEVLERWQKGLESYDGVKHFGPDIDKNFGYDGVLYLIGFLTHKFATIEPDIMKRKTQLENAKRLISKMFGTGKISKDKPSDILNMTRDLYDEMTKEIDKLEVETGGSGNTGSGSTGSGTPGPEGGEPPEQDETAT